MLEKTSDFTNVTAEQLMTKSPTTIDANERVSDALDILESKKITQLLVTSQGSYIGVLHLHDILKEGVVS